MSAIDFKHSTNFKPLLEKELKDLKGKWAIRTTPIYKEVPVEEVAEGYQFIFARRIEFYDYMSKPVFITQNSQHKFFAKEVGGKSIKIPQEFLAQKWEEVWQTYDLGSMTIESLKKTNEIRNKFAEDMARHDAKIAYMNAQYAEKCRLRDEKRLKEQQQKSEHAAVKILAAKKEIVIPKGEEDLITALSSDILAEID